MWIKTSHQLVRLESIDYLFIDSFGFDKDYSLTASIHGKFVSLCNGSQKFCQDSLEQLEQRAICDEIWTLTDKPVPEIEHSFDLDDIPF